MKEPTRCRLASLTITLLLMSITIFSTAVPEKVSADSGGSNIIGIAIFDSVFYKYLYHSERYRRLVGLGEIIFSTAQWKVYCEAYKCKENPRYLAIYVEHWKATWNGDFTGKETHIIIKFYWSDSSYHVYDRQYEPSDGSYSDSWETYTVSIEAGYLTFKVSLKYSSTLFAYKVYVDHGYGYIQWEHERTWWGQLKGKNIFTSAEKLVWSCIFNSEWKTGSLNIHDEIKAEGEIRSWDWTNIGTYNPQ